jgi:prepilin-type processing-associated H-X9-DG protein
VELIVVIGIVALLLAVLLPAVQAARMAAQLAQCQSRLRQVALAVEQHLTALQYYPTGGWAYTWVGDPDRGFARDQPGGWIYNILPYLEEQQLRELGRRAASQEKRQALTKLCETPLAVFRCPSRRVPALSHYGANAPPNNAIQTYLVAKSDFAINGGDINFYIGPGPDSLEQSDRRKYKWPDFSKGTGISFQRSLVRQAQLRDGASKTYLVGEKHVESSGIDLGNDESMYTGHDYDTVRWTFLDAVPESDAHPANANSFGSAHISGFNMAFCDGSIRLITYDIDAELHRRLGNRMDGTPVQIER